MLGAHLCHQWSHLSAVARDEIKDVRDPVRKLLESNAVARNCDHLLELVDPIAHALNLMQLRSTTLAEAVELWVELLQRVPKNNTGYQKVVERSKQALECPFFLLANVLDPRWAGASLSESQVDKARAFAEDEGPEVANALTLYIARAPPFRATMFNKMVDPVAWWEAGAKSGFPSALCSLALRLCACLASTANLERNFSTMGHVFGRHRTQLGVEKAGKLTFLFRSLNSLDAEHIENEDDSE